MCINKKYRFKKHIGFTDTVTVTDAGTGADAGRRLRVFNIIIITTQGSTKHT
jgi:hypothetical protein